MNWNIPRNRKVQLTWNYKSAHFHYKNRMKNIWVKENNNDWEIVKNIFYNNRRIIKNCNKIQK